MRLSSGQQNSLVARAMLSTEVYDQGTLVIDLVDAHTDTLLWRGWAKGSIDGVIDNQQWMEQRIDEAVARIMRALPSRSAREANRDKTAA